MTNINVSVLNGRNGFIIQGVAQDGRLGDAVSNLGDVNGDGLADIIIGAEDVDISDENNEGQVSIIFGSNSFGDRIRVSNLDGSNGFNIDGISNQQRLGNAVSNAGDINRDGISDFIIGANNTDNDRGSSYVIFGNSSLGDGIDLNSLDGSNGFVVNGIAENSFLGSAVSNAGDVNGDGVGDIIIGANAVDANGNEDSGASYVIFGQGNGFPQEIDLTTLDGINGFLIRGVNPGDFAGISVSNAGDINGDDVEDFIVGANRADPGGRTDAGTTYLVFGQDGGFPADINLASLGSDGVAISGIAERDFSGSSVSSLGDINGDGISDIGIGAPPADTDETNAGQGYVIFGTASGFSEDFFRLSDLDGTNGFTINGAGVDNSLGTSISVAGDVNNDGRSDLIVSAVGANEGAGSSYVIFGRESEEDFAATLNLSDLNINQGFTIDGIVSEDRSGQSVSSAGDVNGDGIDDLLVGAPQANNFNTPRDAGEAYVVFGRIENLGDVDNDGAYTNADAYEISRAAVGLVTEFAAYPGIDPLLVADVNSDGVISALDSAIVYSTANGGTSSFILPDLNG